jgi:hypothetical protein
MTIHWKALEAHFLMASLVFRFSGAHFLNFSFSKNLSPYRVKTFGCTINTDIVLLRCLMSKPAVNPSGFAIDSVRRYNL